MHPLSSLASTKPTDPIRPTKVVPLPQDIFGKPIRKDILHRNVVWYLSTLRAGNQHSKTRKTVAYSGKKIMPQKGTGKARVGDRSSGIREYRMSQVDCMAWKTYIYAYGKHSTST